jgi:chaperonin GroES
VERTDFKVLGKRILIERLAAQELQSAMIQLVHLDERPSQFARVLILGTEVVEQVQVGDKIVTREFVGTPVTLGEEDLFLVMESDILAVIDGD